MPAQRAREILGEEKIIGVSASTIEEARKAEADGADYIGTGAVFPTATKDDAQRYWNCGLFRGKRNYEC